MFYLTKAALPYLGEDDSIINTASVNAYIGPEFLVGDTATQGSIISFIRVLSNFVGDRSFVGDRAFVGD